MNTIKQCAACHEQYKKLRFEPFCSQHCEITFHEHAPVELIHKVYEEYRVNTCIEGLRPHYNQERKEEPCSQD